MDMIRAPGGPPPQKNGSTGLSGASEKLVIDVDGELVTVDESTLDFSDLTVDELQFLGRNIGPGWHQDGDPTAGMVATMIAVKLRRGRNWTADHVEAVITVLLAWLTDDLELID